MEESTKGVTRRIRERAYEIIKERPSGIRYSELVDMISKENPSFNLNTIYTQISDLRKHRDYKDKLSQVPRIYIAKKYETSPNLRSKNVEEPKPEQKRHREEEFYEQFANFLRDDLTECTVAKPYGNSRIQHKWSTPDVVGYYRVSITSSFPKDPELVAGELKVDTGYDTLITAFGQAASYLLFSHRSYIAVPEDSDANGLEALENLCILFGIGLLLFDNKDPNEVEFRIRNRAQRHEPNIVYFNDYGVKIINFLEGGSK
ncbi:hypothetical protein Thermo_00124 [Thermoplasmatales archaeon]|nr:hypothetical protein Thermo_00124 [Thermoplasmatales archaeon]